MKIILIGCSGTGKSTLARTLSEKLGLPVLHLDRIWHDPAQAANFHDILADFMDSHESFIVDGNYASTLPMRVQRADLVIWLKIPRVKSIFRVVWRSIKGRLGIFERSDMAEAFTEKFDKEYWEFLKFIWNFEKENFPKMEEALANRPKNCKLIVVKNDREKQRLIAELNN